MKATLLLVAVFCARAADLHDFDLSGDGKALFEQVAHSYGLKCRFDPDYQAGRSIHFSMQQVDYRTALHALEEATHSFVVPLSAAELLVDNDTPEKRRADEPFVEVTVDIPHALTQQELTEILTGVQQTMAIEKVAPQFRDNQVVLRGPVSKILPAQELFESLVAYRPQVSIQMKLMEVSRSDMLALGFDLPTSFPIVNLDSLANTGTALNVIGKGLLGNMALGVGVLSASLIAQMQKSSGRTLLDLNMRSSNNHAASFHAGDRYPIVTSEYVAGPTPSTTSSSNSGNGSGSADQGGTPSNANPTSSFGKAPNPTAVAIADFNGDGLQDVAAAAAGADAAAVMLRKNDGTFQDAAFFPAGAAPAAIVAVDLNHDQFVDLVTADAGSNTVSVLLGNGDGTFQPAMQMAVGSRPVALVVADLDGDGILDIATANSDSNNISILLGTRDGTYQPGQTLAVGSSPRGLVAADLNGDGRLDLASVNFESNNLTVLLANIGGYQNAVNYATGQGPTAIVAGDLNRDGHVDLVVANSVDNNITVLTGDGTGAFAAGVAFPAGNDPVAAVMGDFNRDGAPDVAVANPDDGTISLLLGLGNGSFQAPIAFHTGANPAALTAADVSKDGITDIVAANPSTNNFTLLLGNSAGGFIDPSGNPVEATGGQNYQPPPAFTFEDLGLVVKATPHVQGNQDVALELEAEFKLLTGQVVSGQPVIANRKLSTKVLVPHGDWVVVGGLITNSDVHSMAGLPAPPPVGRRERDRSDDQVLVLIKTDLLTALEEGDSHPISLGTESRPRVPL